jgi:hypothetical protein
MNKDYLRELEKDINEFIIISTNKINLINNKIIDINSNFIIYKKDIEIKLIFNNIILFIIIIYLLLYR